MQKPIYLDYMATTPVDEAIVKKMNTCLDRNGDFGNPASSTHCYGYQAAKLVEIAQSQIAKTINSDPREIIWTSGATEAINLALKGAAFAYQRQGKHIITMKTEHKAVLDTCRFLASQGFEIDYLSPQSNGLLNLDDLMNAIRPDTILISILFVNNETGVIQDIKQIAEISRSKGILLHVDAVQAIGKVKIDIQNLPIDMMSVTAHKVYGPKGIGALYVKRNPPIQLQPVIHGGGHQRGLRSGTLATHQIVGMGLAFEIASNALEQNFQHVSYLRRRLWDGLVSLGGVHLNGDFEKRIPHCLNVRFDGVDGDALLVSLQDIAISAGSACNSRNDLSSHVLTAMGLSPQLAKDSIRISLGRYTTEKEVDYTIRHISEQVNRLRSFSPLWNQAKDNVMKTVYKNES